MTNPTLSHLIQWLKFLKIFHILKKTPNLDQAWRALHLKIDPNLIFRPPWPLSVRRALRQDAEAAEGILCTRLMAHTCKRLFPCGHPIYRFVDLMSGCSGRTISMLGVPYWYLPSYIFFTNHMVLMQNLQTHAQLFPISARNTQSCKSLEIDSCARNGKFLTSAHGIWAPLSLSQRIKTCPNTSVRYHKYIMAGRLMYSLCITSNSLFPDTTPTLIIPSPEAEDWRI